MRFGCREAKDLRYTAPRIEDPMLASLPEAEGGRDMMGASLFEPMPTTRSLFVRCSACPFRDALQDTTGRQVRKSTAMVVNFCLPHFETTVDCNKLSADGYDVSNLLSGDPRVRGRGFKLEYFLRPPVRVTLCFQVRVEVCRVDVELWPPGMDLGRASRGLEIHTCSTFPTLATPTALPSGQHLGRGQEGDNFLLVGRCELKDELSVCFSQPRFQPRPPFPHAPPEPPARARRAELWSRGPQSLGTVTQLRVSLLYGGAGSALGLRALAVWGRPARCCPPLETERIARAHWNSLRPPRPKSTPPSLESPSPIDAPKQDPHGAETPTTIPEEFLDPLTQEVMSLPVLLPSGAMVDSSTLEEYQRQEATWGRSPNDPFTGVPFSPDSQPLHCPQLKGRIDLFVLRGGGGREGRLGRAVQQEQPRPSRLTERPPALPGTPPHPQTSGDKHVCPPAKGQEGGGEIRDLAPERRQVKRFAPDRGPTPGSGAVGLTLTSKRQLEALGGGADGSGAGPTTLPVPAVEYSPPPPPVKKLRVDMAPSPDSSSSSISHEQRLADSLDRALSCALRGFPAFTAQRGHESNTTGSQAGMPAGESRCVLCSCALSQYPSCPPAFRLPCGHLLCRPCLSLKPPNPPCPALLCPVCRAPAPPSAITRVHF
ncbi:hypothetical protein AAFF_G00065630 [Aldrovandia affinis]|uniref:RING-type domain-containing protein n=1 Tax=Aldrovandia affinis TaxID=143900 RepID=A0AAD7T4C7_9TELE|nr:hypothetical protein AAFF_G00065630 [Aldrovandia affinis]